MALAILCCSGCAVAVEPTPSEPQYTKEYLIEQISYYDERMNYATLMKEAAFGLGYSPNHEVVRVAIQEWNAAMTQKKYYQKFLDEILAEEARWEQRMKEYPEATTVWLYFKDLGYNDYVCAGILGNMMSEVGGNTLDIQYWLYNPTGAYYGCCQWSMYYFPEIGGADLNTQLNFLRDTIRLNIDMFGNNYQQGFNYDKFLTLTDERAAALAFADCYERGAPQYNQSRINNATVAYNYFVN